MEKTVDELIEEAGDAEEAPPLPEGGIPKQWLPGWVRWPLRWALLPFVLLDLKMQSLAKKMIRPPFKKVGKCKKRGNCCHYILVKASKGIMGWFSLFWSTELHGFYLRMPKPQNYMGKPRWVMGCRYLQKDGSCGCYRLRPLICRQWPIIERFGYPQILKGCGFQSDPPVNEESEFTIL